MQSETTKNLRIRYVAALSTIALLAILGQILIQYTVFQQSADGRVINIAGRQRMLSQRISKDVLTLQSNNTDIQPQVYLNELDTTLTLWVDSHRGLQEGDATLGLPDRNSDSIQTLFAQIQPHFEAMQQAATCILILNDVRPANDTISCDQTRQDYETIVLDNEDQFLTGMDAIVFQYDAELSTATATLSRIEYILLAVTLIILIIEARLIFRPAIQKIDDTLADLIATQDQLKDRITEVQTARQEAERSNQVKSAFLASMSHELRTPLNAIINFTKFVAQEDVGPINTEQKEMLMESVRSAKHLLSLINDVLDMSKIEAGSLQLFIQDGVDIQSIIEQSVITSRSLVADKPVEIISEIADPLPTIRADQQRLRQVLLNLLSNACKFTNEGHITVRAIATQTHITIDVQDTGVGISPENHSLVFEAFKQTKSGLRQAGGTGLGMPITQSLIQAHGGHVSLTSELGVGTTFTVTIPIIASPTAATELAIL